jgi:lysophospholipase L1-like esterase
MITHRNIVRKTAKFFLLSTCLIGCTLVQAQDQHWIGTWACAPTAPEGHDKQPKLSNVTLREIVHISVGGNSFRIRLTNDFGTTPLVIGAAHIALSNGASSIQPDSDRQVTFGGAPNILISPGAVAISDPIDLTAAASSDLAVSLYLPPQKIKEITFHDDAFQTNFIANGNNVASLRFKANHSVTSWYFFNGIDVLAEGNKSAAIVAMGDSLTDGSDSTPDQNRRWTNYFARRLNQQVTEANLSVLNVGIGGNRILHDRSGPSALSRFDRDVLSQTGVRHLIILEGVNDIGHLVESPIDEISAKDLEAALAQMVSRAHAKGIRVYGATMLPYKGAKYYSLRGEAIRSEVNSWIRTSSTFDAVIDFEKAIRDPNNPQTMRLDYDSGDHLHLNDAGYKAMSEAIDLAFFN